MDGAAGCGPLAASVAVAATVALVAVVARDVPRAEPAPPGPSVPSPTDIEPSEWRTEYWHDVQVDVPADWWFGGSPLPTPPQGTYIMCGGGSVVSPEGERVTPREQLQPQPGWVGRPLALTDVCESMASPGVPVEPYLWFDSPVAPGTVDLGDGWVRETWEVNGTVLTVATPADAVREHVVASASGGETCLANRDDLGEPFTQPQPTDAQGLLLCAYRDESGEAWLTYAAELTPEQVDAFTAEFDAAPEWVPNGRECDLGGSGSEWVVLHVGEATYVVNPGWHGCPVVSQGGKVAELTPELVEPWAVGGIPAVVYGPTGGKGAMIDGFIDVR